MPQLEKARAQQQRPEAAKKKQKNVIKLHVTHRITDVDAERGLRDMTSFLSSVKASFRINHKIGVCGRE